MKALVICRGMSLCQCAFIHPCLRFLPIFRVNYLVLDEADRMLDKGFENDIRSIIQKTSSAEQRQTLMCMFVTELFLGLIPWVSFQSARHGPMLYENLRHPSRKIRFELRLVVTTWQQIVVLNNVSERMFCRSLYVLRSSCTQLSKFSTIREKKSGFSNL